MSRHLTNRTSHNLVETVETVPYLSLDVKIRPETCLAVLDQTAGLLEFSHSPNRRPTRLVSEHRLRYTCLYTAKTAAIE